MLDTTITQYYAPPNVYPVAGLLGAPNAEAWYTRVLDFSIGHIKADGTIDELQDLNTLIRVPTDLQVDPSGNLWVSDVRNNGEDRMARLTPSGDVTLITDFSNVLPTVNSQATPPSAFLPLGKFLSDGSAVLVGLNQDGSFSLFSLPQAGGFFSVQVAQAAGGAFWYRSSNGVIRLDRDGNTTEYTLANPDPNRFLGSVVPGGDGNMWVRIDHEDATVARSVTDAIGRVNSDGSITEFSLSADGPRLQVSSLISDADGTIWFDEQGIGDDALPVPNTHRLGKVATTGLNPGTITEYTLPTGNDSFFSSVGPGGKLWFTQPFAIQDGVPQVSVINKVSISNIPQGPPPGGFLLGQGSHAIVPLLNVQIPNSQGAHASVDLGNGATTTASLSPNSDGSFAVTAPIVYHGSGVYRVTVDVVDGTGIGAIFRTTATVTPGPNEKYVDQLYHDLLGRTPDDGGLAFWTTALDNGLPRGVLAGVLQNAPEARKLEVDQLYQSLLGRPADTAGEQFWVNFLTGSKMGTGPSNAGVQSPFSSPGGSIDQVRAFFLASPEFQQQGDGTVAGYVDRLYQQLLGRIADAQGQVFWGTQIKNTSPLAVVLALAHSDEAARHAATLDLQNTLRRTADPAGVAFFANAISHGVASEVIDFALFASDEFFQKVAASSTVLP